MIKEAYCSFEVAKLLKEKGFNELCFHLIREDGEIIERPSQAWNGMTKKQKAEFYLCPTHLMAMKWLREEKNLFIDISFINLYVKDKTLHTVWYFAVFYLTNPDKHYYKVIEYSTYEEAVEAALFYTLENLI